MKKEFIFLGVIIIVVIALTVFGISSMTGKAIDSDTNDRPVKEFVMDSYYDDKGIWFSLKEITVNKGDKVRIKVTNIKGRHDFVIDEYDIHEDTPINKEVVIEFVADKSGEFIYYCSVPNHREKGQWGTLKVLE
jgi:nitrous oxide reductase